MYCACTSLLTKGNEIDCLLTGSLGYNKDGSICAKSKVLELNASWLLLSGNLHSTTLYDPAISNGVICIVDTKLESFNSIAIVYVGDCVITPHLPWISLYLIKQSQELAISCRLFIIARSVFITPLNTNLGCVCVISFAFVYVNGCAQ